MDIGRALILAGAGLIVLGLVYLLLTKANIPLGRLPGDIVWQGRRTTFYFPIVTCIVLSLLGSFLLWLFTRRP